MSPNETTSAAETESSTARAPALRTRALGYLVVITLLTAAAALPAIGRLRLDTPGWPTFLVLAAAAAVSQLFVVFTPRNQSYHAAIVFLVAATLLLPPELVVLMGIVQHVPEWLRHRYPWFIQTFNICNYTLSGLAAWGVVRVVHGGMSVDGNLSFVAAAAGACLVFVLVNHSLLALMLHLARGHSLRATGLFEAQNLSTDLVLAVLGVTVAAFWHWNHWLAPFALLPLVLVHRSLHVPALREQARTDPKTGLFNPRAFTEALQEELGRAHRFRRPLSVIVADLDHLREINNTYGHLAGDAALVTVANTFRAALREYDLPSRFGGEEFAILLPETGYDEALEVAERVRIAISEACFSVKGSERQISVTISMGVATVPSHGSDSSTLLHSADLALYRAKSSGRNRVVGGDDLTAAAGAQGTTPVPAMAPGGTFLGAQSVLGGPDQPAWQPSAADLTASPPTHPAPLPTLTRTTAAAAAAAASPERANPPVLLAAAPSAAAPSRLEIAVRRTPFLLRVLIGVVGGVGVAAGAVGILLGGSQDLVGILTIVALVAAGQALALESEHGSISIGAVGALTAAATFGMRAALGVALAMAAVEWSARRSSWYQVIFNAGALSLAGLGACGVFAAAHGAHSHIVDVIGGVGAAAVYFALNTGLLGAALALAERERFATLWRQRFAWLAWHYLAYGLLAGVLFLAFQSVGLYALVVAAVPVLVLRRTQAAYLRRAAESTARLRSAAETIQHQNASLVEANRLLRQRSSEALEGLSATVDARDAYTAGHSRRVRDLSLAIGRELGLTEGELAILDPAALFHDIGKLAIPDAILLKPTALDEAEWALMRHHPDESARIVGRLGFLSDCLPAIRHHHERYDGKGYPDRLAGEGVPLGARIIQVADTIDAMLTPRTYRRAHSLEETVAEIERVAGTQICPRCASAATRLLTGNEQLELLRGVSV